MKLIVIFFCILTPLKCIPTGTVYLATTMNENSRELHFSFLSNSTESLRGQSITLKRKGKASIRIPLRFEVPPFTDRSFVAKAPHELSTYNLSEWFLDHIAHQVKTGPIGLLRKKPSARLPRRWRLGSKTLKIPSGTFSISDDLVLDKELEISIGPGTVFELGPDVSVFFRGQFIIKGLRIKSKFPDKAWKGVVLAGHGHKSILQDISIEGGSDGNIAGIPNSCAICLYGGEYSIERLRVVNSNSEDGLNAREATIRMRDSVFRSNRSDGFDCDTCKLSVIDSTFQNIGGDAIDVSTSSANISNTIFQHVGDKAISAGEGSNLSIQNNRINNASIGIAVKDNSTATIESNLFYECATNLAAYNKKPFWKQGGRVRLIKNRFNGGKQYVDELSKITELEN